MRFFVGLMLMIPGVACADMMIPQFLDLGSLNFTGLKGAVSRQTVFQVTSTADLLFRVEQFSFSTPTCSMPDCGSNVAESYQITGPSGTLIDSDYSGADYENFKSVGFPNYEINHQFSGAHHQTLTPGLYTATITISNFYSGLAIGIPATNFMRLDAEIDGGAAVIVPEPTTLAFCGIVGLLAIGRRLRG
jgi:hypothetical protein